MVKGSVTTGHADTVVRVRRGYFECRFGQLHVHNTMPPGGGFDEGTSLLCLHEQGQSGRAFAQFLATMGRDRSVYAPDVPGSGESDAPPAPASIADYAAAIGDFCDSMRLRQVDVLGYQSGALLAAELAIARPQQVRRVVLVSVPLRSGTPREAISQMALVAQPTLVLRPHDELWESTARIPEVLPRVRVVDLPQLERGFFATAPQIVADTLREFLRA